MPGSLPPYALELTSFRFPALAALAGRAPLGGAREAALATLIVARLAADTLRTGAANGAVEPAARAERAGLARQWLTGVTLPVTMRSALARAVDAAGLPAPASSLRAALEAAGTAVGPLLDPPSRAELQHLARSLDS